MPDAFASDPGRVARFVREAQTLASLNHPHIAQIYGVEESPSTMPGHAYGVRALVMELVPGDTLAERIARGPIAIDEALPIARQIAEALEAAHDAGIIHRDLKPANIKLRPDGTVKVLDFGLAKISEEARLSGRGGDDPLNSPTFTSPAMTQAGVILGTAAYMSPEQARGREVDKRADIWAFGCVLYEMLTGGAPFPGETVTDVIAAVVKNEPDWASLPAATPPSVRRTLARCLRKDPRMRLRDIGDARLEIVEADAVEPAATPTRGAPFAGLADGDRPRRAHHRRRDRRSLASTRRLADRDALDGRNVSAAPPTVMNPLLSPDGQLLAFQTTVDGQSQIAVMNPEAGTWRVLTSDRSRGLVTTHDWAPDGSRIFFDRQTDTLNGVFSVPSLGGEERLVLENAGLPNALPNGDLLVVRVNAQRQMQLHRFSPSTGRVDPLPVVPDAGASDDVVVVSPDGRRAYFFGQPLQNAGAPPAFFHSISRRVRRRRSRLM